MQCFPLKSLRFFESCSAAGATQCQGNTEICFHQRNVFPAKLAAAIIEALTGKHFHSACARRGVLHQWLSDRVMTFTFWSLSISFLLFFPCLGNSRHFRTTVTFFTVILTSSPNISSLFSSYRDAGWQWSCVCLRICTLQGQNSQGEKNKYCVTLSFPAQQR